MPIATEKMGHAAMGDEQAREVTILVLGPMEQRDRGTTTAQARTTAIKNILVQIGADLAKEAEFSGIAVKAVAPEDRRPNVIIPGILGLIEHTDLVVIDMSGGRANVGYEAGIVHALGLPYVILTSDPRPPFYFQGAECICDFHFSDTYDSAQATHGDLWRRLRRFLSDPDAVNDYADNQLTQYYSLPLVDVAGPSGLAAGYYRNGVRRFVRAGGFLDEPCDVTWTASFESKDGVETRHTERRTMTISHLIAVRPHGGLIDAHSVHSKRLDDALADLGFRLQFATIQKREKEFHDMRDFGGQFLARVGKRGEPVDFVNPAIVVDTPTTLYALQFSPRVRKLYGSAGSAREERRKRLLDQMQAAFDRNLDYQLQQEMDQALNNRFRLIDLEDLPATLRDFRALT